MQWGQIVMATVLTYLSITRWILYKRKEKHLPSRLTHGGKTPFSGNISTYEFRFNIEFEYEFRNFFLGYLYWGTQHYKPNRPTTAGNLLTHSKLLWKENSEVNFRLWERWWNFTASKVRWSYILLTLTLARSFTKCIKKMENVVPRNIYLYRYPHWNTRAFFQFCRHFHGVLAPSTTYYKWFLQLLLSISM